MLKYMQTKISDKMQGISVVIEGVLEDFENSGYECYNPLAKNPTSMKNHFKPKNCFVFVADGGSYADYQNLCKLG